MFHKFPLLATLNVLPVADEEFASFAFFLLLLKCTIFSDWYLLYCKVINAHSEFLFDLNDSYEKISAFETTAFCVFICYSVVQLENSCKRNSPGSRISPGIEMYLDK